MHPANLYAAGEPDFAALAAAHTPLAQHLVYPAAAAAAAGAGSSSSSSRGARPVLDFTSWEATKELTAALLKVGSGAEPNQGFYCFVLWRLTCPMYSHSGKHSAGNAMRHGPCHATHRQAGPTAAPGGSRRGRQYGVQASDTFTGGQAIKELTATLLRVGE